MARQATPGHCIEAMNHSAGKVLQYFMLRLHGNLPAYVVLGSLSAAVLSGCASSDGLQSHSNQAPVIVIEPLEIRDASFLTRGPRFADGLIATVRLCADHEGKLVSADVVVSSGEKRFDDFVVDYARRVQVNPQRENGRPVHGCNTVKVQINRIADPIGSAGAASALG
jgi:TonB family protein